MLKIEQVVRKVRQRPMKIEKEGEII